MNKPLNGKAYGSIPHLPNSRLGPKDYSVTEGQAMICTKKARDGDRIIVQEKLDGSCCSVARINGSLVPLNRAGWPCISAPWLHHRMFHNWAMENCDRFDWLREGERVVGEWLALAHGTRYKLWHEPFVPFDIIRWRKKVDQRATFDEFRDRIIKTRLITPFIVSIGVPISTEFAVKSAQERNYHGAIDPVEGVVYRVERLGRVEFLAKFVIAGKIDGKYFAENYGEEVWNWTPDHKDSIMFQGTIAELLNRIGKTRNMSEGRRVIVQGAIKVDNKIVDDLTQTFDFKPSNQIQIGNQPPFFLRDLGDF